MFLIVSEFGSLPCVRDIALKTTMPPELICVAALSLTTLPMTLVSVAPRSRMPPGAMGINVGATIFLERGAVKLFCFFKLTFVARYVGSRFNNAPDKSAQIE